MPGPPRVQYENAFYHVMNRGRGRRWIFHGEAYYEAFPGTLEEAYDTPGRSYVYINNVLHRIQYRRQL